ncbi:MAG: aldehyde dehydrogenase family protein, partial [Inhella sp.]|uniref:aldehyde dehydrogenase family protein n=1 Tax=Inhella sp. TaxID=1921806 RepID=UPI00391F6F67
VGGTKAGNMQGTGDAMAGSKGKGGSAAVWTKTLGGNAMAGNRSRGGSGDVSGAATGGGAGAESMADYGLTASVWTRDLVVAHRAVGRIQAGYVWVNNSSQHFLGAPFGGYKQSGIGREECFEELLEFTQVKNVNVNLD